MQHVFALHLFLLLSSISCIDIPPFLFIYSPVDGHLDCFHCLAIINNVIINVIIEINCADVCFYLFWVET